MKYDKPCPVCGTDSEIFPEDYENRFLVKCPECAKYYTEQTIEEKMNIDEHPYFEKIENEDERKALSKWIKNNQDGDEPPTVSRHGE